MRRTWVVWVGVFFMFKAGYDSSTANAPRAVPYSPPVIFSAPPRGHADSWESDEDRGPPVAGKATDRRGPRRQSAPPPAPAGNDRW